MILIPIGHDEASVRRLPWVTFGLIAACLAVLVISGAASAPSSHDRQIEEDLSAAVEYWLEHPHLELDPELERLVVPEEMGSEREALLGALQSMAPSSDEGRREAEQMELDRLTEKAQASIAAHPFMRFGLRPSDPTLLGILGHMLLHAGWLHLLGNMLILYLAGPYIEDVWGRGMFAAFYLGSGLAAALAHGLAHSGSAVPMIGASGAIAGVMGAFLVRYWSTRIRFFYMVGLVIRGTFASPAWVMLPLWVLQQLFMASATGNVEGGGVAYWAHIGGFAFGAAAAFGIQRSGLEERWLQPAVEQKLGQTVLSNVEVELALAERDAGNVEQAISRLERHLEATPGDPDGVLALWSLAVDEGCPRRAMGPMHRLICNEVRSGNATLAVEHWSELTRYVPTPPLEPVLAVRLARAQLQAEQHEEACTLLRRALTDGGSAMPPAALLQLAQLGADLDQSITESAVEVGLTREDVDPAIREQLEALREQATRPLSC